MLLKLGPFAGELPKLAPEHLPEAPSFATVCEDAKLYSGDLIPYRALGPAQTGGEVVLFVGDRKYTFDDADITAIPALQDSTRLTNPEVFTSGEKESNGDEKGLQYWKSPTDGPYPIGFRELVDPALRGDAQPNRPTWTYSARDDSARFPATYTTRVYNTPSQWDSNYRNSGESIADAERRYLSGQSGRAYVYTLVNELGWESKPSPPSTNPERVRDGDRTHVVFPELSGLPANTKYRLYRTRAGETSAGFFRATDEDLTPAQSGDTLYTDWKRDNFLGLPLSTERWDPPISTLRGLSLVQNGILAAFAGKHLHFSQPGLPWAWPIENGYDLDDEIIAISTVTGRCVVLTDSTPYLIYGSEPHLFIPRKLESPHGCTSRKSVIEIDNKVVYASYTGLIQIASSLESEEASTQSHSWETWEADLDPRTIAAGWHRGKYLAVHDVGTPRAGGFLYDFREQVPWVESLAHLTDAIDVVSDFRSGRTFIQLSGELFEFDSSSGAPITYLWRSRAWVFPNPLTFTVIAVVADFDATSPPLRGPGAQRARNADASRPVPPATRRLGTSQIREPQVTVRLYYDRSETPAAEASFVDTTPARFRVADSGLHQEVEVEVESSVRVKRVYLGQTMSDLKGG